MTKSVVKITSSHEITGVMSTDRLNPGWQYSCSIKPPASLKITTHVMFRGCLRGQEDIHVFMTLKGISGRYERMTVSLRSAMKHDETVYLTWMEKTLFPLFETSPNEFEDAIFALIVQDCDPRDRKPQS